MKRILYLGLDPSHYSCDGEITHWPIIRIAPMPISDRQVLESLRQYEQYTHLIFTSKSAVMILQDYLNRLGIDFQSGIKKIILAVGKVTAMQLDECGMIPTKIAANETAEGIIELLEEMPLANAYIFWPHSAEARPVISDYLKEHKIPHRTCILYYPECQSLEPIPQLESFEEIVFTSPSTVKAFQQIFGAFPKNIRLKAIGPVTEAFLEMQTKITTQ